MLISEKVRILESPLVPAIAHSTAQANSSSTPSDEGIAIPFHPQFFPHAKGMEREEGEITSSKPSSVTSDVPHWPSPPKRYSIDGGKRPRRSPTPEPARHRQPSSRTYLHRSPECLVRPLSGRSQSPSHPRRPISPEYMTGRRTHSPEGPRRRRSTPGAKIPQTFEPAPPRSPRSAMHKRRGSDYDARRSNDSGESYVSRENYKESTYPEGHKDAFMARDVSNHNRGRESTGERDSVESLHTKPSINSNDHKTDHRRSFSGGLTTPSPSSASRPLSDAASSSQLVKPCHNVPGLWMVKSGRKNIEIVTCEFEIDKITADRWGVRGSSTYVCSSQSWKWVLHVLLSDMAKKRHTRHCHCHLHVCHFRKLLRCKEGLTWLLRLRKKSPTKWLRLRLFGLLLAI